MQSIIQTVQCFFLFTSLQDGFTALTIAAKEGYEDIVQELLAKDAYVNVADRVRLLVSCFITVVYTFDVDLALQLVKGSKI